MAEVTEKQVPIISPDGTKSYVPMSEFMRKVQYANLSAIRLRDLERNKDYNPTFSKYTKDQIVSYLNNPANYEKQLRQMSIYLFNISNYYRRLIQYFAYMSTYSYILIPCVDFSKSISQNKFKKAYYSAATEVEKMNIQHEFSKAMVIAFRDDVYYGYSWETNDSFAFQNLDADYCKISSIEDGIYNFAFNFSYFDSYPERLPNFPPEFTTMYNQYKANTQVYKWQELSSENSICLKVNEHSFVPVPPFVSLFSALADIEDYRAITKNASVANNYKALALEIPVDDEGTFLIDYDLCKEFYEQMCSVLPSNIGAIMTPMKITDWNFEKSSRTSDTDDVQKAENSMWSQAGVNKILFGGGDDPSSSTLTLSTINDQMIVFAMMRQIERWVNRKLKQMSGSVRFKIKILDVTHFNKKEMHDQYVKDGTYGLPVRTSIMATNGYTPNDVENMMYLENVFMNYSEREVPLKSSNVQSGDTSKEAGRPTNESKGEAVTDAGETAQEEDTSSGG